MQRARRDFQTLWTTVPKVLVQDFAFLLALYIKRAKLNYASFSERIGRSRNYATGVIAGRHAPPLDELKTWAKILGLNAEEFAQFEEEAWLVHCPPALVERFRGMKRQLEGL